MRNTVKILLIAALIILDVSFNSGSFCLAQNDEAFGAAAKLQRMNERFDRNQSHYKKISEQIKKHSSRRSGRGHCRRSRHQHRVRVRHR